MRLLQIIGPGLHRHAPGDLGHRGEQRQATGGRGHRFVADAHRAAGEQILGLVRIGSQVQVGEQHLALAQHAALDGLRLLDLDDQFGTGEHLGRGRDNARAGAAIGLVVHADALPGVVLDDHLVAMVDRLAHARRRQSHSVLQYLDFLRHTDAHGSLPASHTR